MVTRIVKLTLKSESCDDFLEVFERTKGIVRSSEGCISMTLHRDIHKRHIFLTYSHWIEESYLNQYRDSVFFREFWPGIKPFFAAPAEAWTVDLTDA